MENTFKSGDKVLTKIKGQQVEAVVNQIYNQEVQVRTTDKKLLWRTVKTVALVEAAAGSPAAEPETPKKSEALTPPPTPANADGAGAVAPPPLPAVKHSEPNEELPKSGPALAPASETASNSVKYKRTRSLWPKRKKI